MWLGSVAHYHGDERYYTDAALRMIERHDPWTPVYAGGAARLNKPLLTYWLVIGTYVTAGVSLFLSRLPFLVAGGWGCSVPGLANAGIRSPAIVLRRNGCCAAAVPLKKNHSALFQPLATSGEAGRLETSCPRRDGN